MFLFAAPHMQHTLTTFPLLAREKAEDDEATQEGHPLPQEEVRRESGLNDPLCLFLAVFAYVPPWG